MSAEDSVFRILLAEDNPADVVLVREALKEHGLSCELDVMSDGEKAIAFLRALDCDPNARELDLVLVDMHLPKRDGPEILEALRNTTRHASTPVIVMTSSESPGVREAAERHSALHYFHKPSTLAQFMQLGEIVRGILTARANQEARA